MTIKTTVWTALVTHSLAQRFHSQRPTSNSIHIHISVQVGVFDYQDLCMHPRRCISVLSLATASSLSRLPDRAAAEAILQQVYAALSLGTTALASKVHRTTGSRPKVTGYCIRIDSTLTG
jgi:hypothetical protein